MKAAVQHFLGQTTDPGIALFRRLRGQWHSIDKNLDNLVRFDWDGAAEDMRNIAAETVDWAQNELRKGTFPREDYKELLELVVINLGGTIEGFTFHLPQNDSNARWMSKAQRWNLFLLKLLNLGEFDGVKFLAQKSGGVNCWTNSMSAKAIYNLKMRLLSKVFKMSEDENRFVQHISDFVCCCYAQYWFTTSLPCSAPRQDLTFMNNLEIYRKSSPKFFWDVIRSTYKHLWYVTPQLVTLALFDRDLESTTKEEMAQLLHQTERGAVATGKPTFPTIAPGARYRMSDFIGPESWLLFNLCGIEGPQDWLLKRLQKS